MANTRAVIDVQINTGQAASALRGLQAQVNSFQSALNTSNRVQASAAKNLASELSEMVNAGGFFTAEAVRMQTAASRLDKTLQKGQGTIGQFWNARFKKGSNEAAAVLSLANARASALETQFVATGAAANGFRDSIAIRPLQAFNSQTAVSAQKLAIHRAMLTQSTTSMINFGKNTQWAGRQLMVGFTVPLTIFAATSGKVFREIEKEAINFRKVYGDAFTPPGEMEENLEAVKELAKEYTKYGIAVKDTIGLAAQAAAAGSQGADLIDATTEATRLATLGQMDQSEALETTIALQTAFGLKSKDLTKTINFLNMVENQTVVTLQDLAQAIPRVAPVIKGLGGSVEDMAAMLAAMQEGGVSAAQGANALKSGLASLINPTNRAVEKLGELGININAIVDANRGDLMGTVQGFARALSTLDEFGKQQALEKVFGKYQYARLGALFNNIIKDGSQASRVMDTAALSAAQLAASATKELGAIEESSATKFVAAMERLKLAIAPVGEMFTQMAIPVLEFLGKLVEKFNSLPDFAKKFIGFGTVITGIIIPAGTMFLGLLMNLAGTLIKFGNVIGVAFKGFTKGGIVGSIQAVSQTLKYMSLAEIDAANAAMQLGQSTEFVNMALRDQPLAAGAASTAVDELAASYQILAARMADASRASVAGGAFAVPGAAMAKARGGASNLVGRPLPIVARNSGGTIPGTGNRDTVPAVLTPGEFVVNKKATQENISLLHAINSGKPVSMLNTGGAPVMTAAMQRVLARVQTQRQEAATIPIAMGGRGGTRKTQAANAASSRNSQEIYNTLTGNYEKGRNVRVDTLRFAVEKLGFNPEQLGLKTRGNLTFRMSKDSNLAMMRGDLTRDKLIKELDTPDVYSPLAKQLDSYLGAQLDRNVFDRMYKEEILKLPMTGINNKRFEKASRNAVRRYLDSAGFPKTRRNSFIRDILQGDTVNANMSLPAIKQALDARGIKYTTGKSKKDLYVDMDGRQVNIGNLAGREAGNLGRPEGVLDYAGLRGSGEAVHANKGGLISKGLGNLISLFTTKGGLPGVGRGRELLNQKFIEESKRAGLDPSKFNVEGSTSGAGRYGSLIEGLSLQRGHVASSIDGKKSKYLPGLMFWQSKQANQGLAQGKLTGKELLEDFINIEKNGMYPASLMTVGGERLGLSKKQIAQIDEAYSAIKQKLNSKKYKDKKFTNDEFTDFTEDILRRKLDADAFDALYNIGTLRSKETGKSIASSSLEDFNKMQTMSLGGIVAAANAAKSARGRIPGNIVDWFSKMTTSINQSTRDDLLQNIPANIRKGLSTARKKIDITRGSVDPVSGGSLKDISSWSTGQGVGRFMESSRLFETLENSKFQIGFRSQGMKKDIDWLKTLGPDGPAPGFTHSPFNKTDGPLNIKLTPKDIQESGGVIWKANKKKLEERIQRDQEFIAGHQKIIDDLQESYIPTIYKTSVKKGEKFFDVSERIVPKDAQRLDNPAASTDILQEKEVALLGAKLSGKPKTKIVEKAEAQMRFDKAKEEIKNLRMAIVRGEISRDKAKPMLSRLYDESENMASFVNWGRGREVSYPNVVSRNMGGIIPGIQQLMAGARVQPYVRPKKPAGPRVTELEKEVMRRRSELSIAKDQGLNDLIFRRNKDGKLDLTAEELLVLLRSNPNVSDKQLKEIAKYHSSRIKKGMFGHFDKERGYKVVDRSAGTWRTISQVLDERGYPVVQKRNIGGQIFDSTKTSRTIVPGVGNKDTVPAMLTPGEFVINKNATSKNLDILRAINGGQIQGFAKGGKVIGYEYASARPITDPEEAKYLARTGAGIYANERDARSGRNAMDSKTIGREIGKAIAISRQTTTSSRTFGFGRENRANAAIGRGLQGMGGMKGMGASMGIGMAGGALMMGAGAVGESNAGLGAAMSAGGLALSMGSMLPMLGPMLAPLAAIAVPAGIVAAALGAAGAALYIWRKSVDDAATKAAEFGANIGGTANALNTMAQVLGTQTPAQARQKAVMGISSEEEATIANEFSGVFESGAGQKFIEDLQNSTSAERFQKLSDYLKTAIASGMMDQKSATTFAKAVGLKLEDSILSNQAVSSILGQESGTSAIKEIADMRKQAVEASGSLAELNASTGEASLSNEAAGRAIGAAGQIIQDYGNVIGVAQQQYAEGTISWDEYHSAITEARLAQEQYTNVIKKSVANAAEQGAARQALDQQLIASGLTEDQVGAITSSTDIGMSTLGLSGSEDYKNFALAAIGRNIPAMIASVMPSQTAYQKEFVSQQADVQFGKSFDELDAEQQASLLEQSKEAQDLAREVDVEGLNEAIKASVRAGDMTAEQAAQFGQEVMYNVDALKALQNGASIATAQFIMLADNIPGLTDAQQKNVEQLGIEFESIGGDTNQFSNYIAALPEEVRDLGVKNFEQAVTGADIDSKRKGRGAALSAEERERRGTDLLVGRQSLSESIGAEQAVRLQSKDAYQQALTQEGGSAKINKAFATAAEAGVSEKVISYIIRTEGAKDADDFVDKTEQMTTATQEIMGLPDEIIKGLGIDVTLPSDLEKYGPMVENLKNNWEIIQDLNPNIDKVATMKFITTGPDGKDATPDQIASNVKTLNDAWNDLSSGNKNTRLEAIRQLIISTQDENGNVLEPEQVDSAYSDLVAEFGGKIMNLPPDVINKLIILQVEIEGLDEAIAAKKAQLALTSSVGQGLVLQKEIEVLEQAKATKLAAQTSTVSNAPKPTGGGGGGGGEKSIAQQLKEQAKLSGETFKGMSKLQDTKGFKNFISGPFAPEFLEYLRSQGAAGLKLIKGGLEKVRAAYANYQKSKISEGAAMAALTPQSLIQESKKTALSSKYNKQLARKGMYSEDIDAIRQLVTDEDLLAKKQLENKKKKGTITKQERAELRAYIKEQKAAERYAPQISKFQKTSDSIVDMRTETTLLNAEIDLINEGRTPELAAAMAAAGLKAGDATKNVELFTDAYNKFKEAQYKKDPGKLDQEKRDNLMEINDLNRQIEELNVIKPLEDQVKVQEKIIDGQEKLVRVKQQEIDVIDRAIELKQRELKPLDDQIEKLQELSDKTSEAYDAQIEALDEIYNREEDIAKLKEGQLNVAQALSRGDVAAAAQGALAMSQELSRQSREQARSALESQKENAIQNIQNKIIEIEKQRKKINQDIEDLQMRQRVIQDDIYTIQSTKILPAENEIYRLQGLINVEAEKLEGKYNNAATQMANLVYQLERATAEKARLAAIVVSPLGDVTNQAAAPAAPAQQSSMGVPTPTFTSAQIYAMTTGQTNQSKPGLPTPPPTPPAPVKIQTSMGIPIPSAQPKPLTSAQIYAMTTGQTNQSKPGIPKKKIFGGFISKYAIGGRVGYKGSTERAPGMMYGGSAKKYAYGSIVPGRGMTDKVPALLTPGEFVVRKRVAEQYGPLLELINGQVFPTMKTNSFNSSSQAEKSGSMYNYNVNVTLNGSEMDANDVANAVIQKIKMTENKGIRSNNIRG